MFKNLKAEMARQGFTNKDIASAIGVNISTVTFKLNEPDRLKFCEAREIKKKLFPNLTMEYLFKDDCSENSETLKQENAIKLIPHRKEMKTCQKSKK